MPTGRLLTVSLLLSAAIPPAVAQSAPTITWQFTAPASPRITRPAPPLRFLVPMQFGAAAPTPSATSPAPALTNPFESAPRAPYALSQSTLNHLSRRALFSPQPILIARLIAAARQNLIAGRQDSLCLDLRTYTVAPDSPGSDSTHLTGSSTCQLASNFSAKYAADPHPLLLR
jgi:hypothetical protein